MIHILEKKVADKIAAGEVIDRPVSIIKELVENSIDAGADDITIEIKNGGKSYIRVTDNGSGISADDVETAFMRHATSKIQTEDDLEKIGTLGFRGEALASICAVSRVELITKTHDEKVGRRVVIEGSAFISNTGTGCPDGTTITVRDLFYNVPARRKFLSSDSGETRRITDMVSKIALSYPDIRFALMSGSSRVFVTQGKGNILNTIISIYGKDTGRDLLPVDHRSADVLVRGYVSSPAATSPSRGRQIFCVNGRVVTSRILEGAIDDAYREKLFSGRYPAAFIFISMPPEKLDVNVHPTKKEIRFEDSFEIKDTVAAAVRRALATMEALPKIREEHIVKEKPVPESTDTEKAVPEEQVDIKQLLSTMREESIADTGFDGKDAPAAEEGGGQEHTDPEHTGRYVFSGDTAGYTAETPTQREGFPEIASLKVRGTVFDTYIMATDDDCLYFIDQHAAHERIFYEKLLAQYRSEEKASQRLMIPINMDVPAQTAEAEDTWIGTLRSMGYDIEYFGRRTYIIREIPAFMEQSEAESFLFDVFSQLGENTDLTDRRTLEKIIMRSCKSAVKGGDILADEEVGALMKDLASCENPFSCPHGRPTFVRMTRYEMEKMFKRV